MGGSSRLTKYDLLSRRPELCLLRKTGAVLVCVFAAIDQEKNHENELTEIFCRKLVPCTASAIDCTTYLCHLAIEGRASAA